MREPARFDNRASDRVLGVLEVNFMLQLAGKVSINQFDVRKLEEKELIFHSIKISEVCSFFLPQSTHLMDRLTDRISIEGGACKFIARLWNNNAVAWACRLHTGVT